MALLARIGERVYEFPSQQEVMDAREIYAHWTGDQNSFEVEMENVEIDFILDMEY